LASKTQANDVIGWHLVGHLLFCRAALPFMSAATFIADRRPMRGRTAARRRHSASQLPKLPAVAAV